MKKKHTYRLKSKFRFSVFIAIVIVLSVSLTNVVMGLDNASANEELSHQVYVCAGDTLWDIAKANASENSDIREAVYKITVANGLTNESLLPGMVLNIPNNL